MRFAVLFAALVGPAAVSAADAIAFLPAETDAVLVVRTRDVAGSELFKKVGTDVLRNFLKANRQAADALTASGLDPLADFERITLGLDLGKTNPPKPFALLEGKFDTAKVSAAIADYMTKNPGKVSAITVAGKSAYKVPGGKAEETMFTAILDDTKMVISPTEKDIEAAFAVAAGTRKSAISKELAALLTSNTSTAPIYLRAWVKGKLKDVNAPNEKLKSQVQSIEWLSAAIRVTNDVAVELQAGTTDAAAAKQMGDLLTGLLGLARFQVVAAAQDQPELTPFAELLRSVKVAPAAKTLTVTGSVKGSSIDAAVNPPPTPPKKK